MQRLWITLSASICMIISCGFMEIVPLTEARTNVINQKGDAGLQLSERSDPEEKSLTPMEALDLVKEVYATDFERVYYKDTTDYYYKLKIADYYLVYEDTILDEQDETNIMEQEDTNITELEDTNITELEDTIYKERKYLIHLYEFVVDDPDTGIGHTVTYGWYTVDKYTGEVKNQTQ